LAPWAGTVDLSPEPSWRNSASLEPVTLPNLSHPFAQSRRLVGRDRDHIAFTAESFDLGASNKQVQFAYAVSTFAEVNAVAVIKPAATQELVDLRLRCPHTDSEDVVIALVSGRFVVLLRHGATR